MRAANGGSQAIQYAALARLESGLGQRVEFGLRQKLRQYQSLVQGRLHYFFASLTPANDFARPSVSSSRNCLNSLLVRNLGKSSISALNCWYPWVLVSLRKTSSQYCTADGGISGGATMPRAVPRETR